MEAAFKLRKVCNELLADLKTTTQDKNIIKLSVDIQLLDKFKGSPDSLLDTITKTAIYLSNVLINGVINIEIIQRSVHIKSIIAHIVVTGLGSSRLDSSVEELNILLSSYG